MSVLRRAGVFAIFAVCWGWLGISGARAGQVFLNGLAVGGGDIDVNVLSFQERKFSTTVRQEYDFSCGSAALATLLTFTYHRPSTESGVFTSMFVNGDQPVIEKQGFSLLDMKNYLSRIGLPSGGFKASLAKLAEIRMPAIVLINEHGFRHFVVIRGIQDGQVLLADPAIGLRTESAHDFQQQWSGIFLIILANVQAAQASFNGERDWSGEPGAPLDLSRFAVNLSTLQQVMLPNPYKF
ncbi:C39 family peptidase [Acidocella aquatica]|uniref:C39 family peptidase n=1 Tax=Acidocella aquatica TaxID=1922313 RepID=UPI0024E11CA3|nr:C39 family peptidase [Acidocella aquatica]